MEKEKGNGLKSFSIHSADDSASPTFAPLRKNAHRSKRSVLPRYRPKLQIQKQQRNETIPLLSAWE